MKNYRVELVFSMIIEANNKTEAESTALLRAVSMIDDEYQVFVEHAERVDENYKPIDED